MAARPIDAAEGYRLFLRHEGAVEFDEINEYLLGLSLRPVSPRMLIHFRRLYRHGYESYIPINRLDIALAGEYAWSDELRARYSEVSQTFPAEITWDARTYPAVVESLGAASATATSDAPPPAGTSLVLRLVTTGIARTGKVVRADPHSGRFHIAFDPYTSVPVAPRDSPYQATLRFALADEAESLAAVTDLMLKLDRVLVRSTSPQEVLVRVSRLSLNTPLEILLVGGPVLAAAVYLLKQITEIRQSWYEGTKAKYEAEGIQLDNEQKRRNAQLEADRALSRGLDAELGEVEDTPLLDQISTPTMPKGDPGSAERHRLVEAAQSAIELPTDLVAELEEPDTVDDGGGDDA